MTTYCIIIPCYNHGATMPAVIEKIAAYQLPCIIVDDGSQQATSHQLQQLAEHYDWIILHRHPTNQGKGKAVSTALHIAADAGYSHALQIDADGQHQLADIAKFIQLSQQYPDDVISGQPVYDQSIPKSRYYSRYLTHCWVWLETLSFSIKDSMCGFRIYPVKQSVTVIQQAKLGNRMDFDIEILVRLYWYGLDIRYIPTQVIYPENGLSHFHLWRDNLLISKMHTKLFFAMLSKIPTLIKRNRNKQPHWSQTKERQGVGGIKLMLTVYRLFGYRGFTLLLYPVVGYFWLTGSKQRLASKQYIRQLEQYHPAIRQKKLNSFKHFLHFSRAMLDKIASWQGDIQLQGIRYPEQQLTQQLESKKGTLLIGAHLGNFEVCRALAELSFDLTINALVFTEHAEQFNRLMQELNPQSNINLIAVDNVGPDTAILLKQKIDAGEWVAIVGDRTSLTPHQRLKEQQVIWSDFLGQPAPFPKGPFILASILKCPTFLMFCLKPEQQFEIIFESFADPLVINRADRQGALQQYIDHYAQRLEHYCIQSPLDWFNFYHFWQLTLPSDELQGD